jgi:hypothetical protein
MRRNLIIYFCAVLFCLLGKAPLAAAQNNGGADKVLAKIHSAYIYQLSKYFVWPDANSGENDFYIGIYGKESLDERKELEAMAQARKANGQNITILQFDSPQDIRLDCHILFVPYASSNSLNEILMKTQKLPILVVSAKEGLGKVGSPVNFITVNGKPSFELNVDAVEKRNLKYIQQLKAIAVIL